MNSSTRLSYLGDLINVHMRRKQYESIFEKYNFTTILQEIKIFNIND